MGCFIGVHPDFDDVIATNTLDALRAVFLQDRFAHLQD